MTGTLCRAAALAVVASIAALAGCRGERPSADRGGVEAVPDAPEIGRRPKDMELPRYCIVGARPVKAVATDDGGMDVLAFDWQSGEFRRDMGYLARVTFPDVEVDIVSEAEFEHAVSALRAKLAGR